jgi:hypothetical protein
LLRDNRDGAARYVALHVRLFEQAGRGRRVDRGRSALRKGAAASAISTERMALRMNASPRALPRAAAASSAAANAAWGSASPQLRKSDNVLERGPSGLVLELRRGEQLCRAGRIDCGDPLGAQLMRHAFGVRRGLRDCPRIATRRETGCLADDTAQHRGMRRREAVDVAHELAHLLSIERGHGALPA